MGDSNAMRRLVGTIVDGTCGKRGKDRMDIVSVECYQRCGTAYIFEFGEHDIRLTISHVVGTYSIGGERVHRGESLRSVHYKQHKLHDADYESEDEKRDEMIDLLKFLGKGGESILDNPVKKATCVIKKD